MTPSPGWQPISRVCDYLNWAHTTRPALSYVFLSCSAFLALRENSSSPQSLIRTPYIILIVPGPCHSLHTFFQSRSIQAHTPSALATLSSSESSALSPTPLCSKPHLLAILRFQDDCIASYPHSTEPIHHRTSLIVLDISRYPCLIDPRHQATLISLTFHLNQQTTT